MSAKNYIAKMARWRMNEYAKNASTSRHYLVMFKMFLHYQGLYAFLRNDYTSAFFGKGKGEPMQTAIKKEKIANAFSNLVEGETSHEVFSIIEEYVCLVYSFKCDNMNGVIKTMFEERLKPKSAERPLNIIKSLDRTKQISTV